MPNLHAHYHHGSVKAFRQELDGTAPPPAHPAARGSGAGAGSGSAGRSWTMPAVVRADPNERDAGGRTVLHLAASTPTPQAHTFFAMLLRSPGINVNLQDAENGYTALHRALYAGNIRAARDLLARADIDVAVKDAEGLTAFDVYNSTVDGTNPPKGDIDGTDMYVWGVNRNYALGTGDSADKTWPDRVNLLTQRQASEHPDPAQRFYHVGVKDVVMAKLHTGVVTTEAAGNVSLCGFGSGGRLGRSVHSQLALLPLPDLPHTIVSIALGQDHTLALTSGGYILSWGNNRFSQLGYAVEAPEKFGKEADEVQTSPKRIVGPLKKEHVRGVAAGRMASACWTATDVWTWGTNLGHLGYEKAATATQVVPRKVPAITQGVLGVALSDYAMLCLLDTNEVLCFHHDTHFKINFSSPQRSLKTPKNPGQVNLDPTIVKVTSCGQTFATLSKKGDVCTFQLPHPSEEANVRDRHVTVKPQVQWALRKSFTAVRDMALGSDGTMIICTYSGHVFVRQRMKSGAQFRRIPYLQRVIKVATNESGAFAAVRVDARPSPIALEGKTVEEDLFLLQPHFRRFESQMNAQDFERVHGPKTKEEDEEDETSNSVTADSVVALAMCQVLNRWQATAGESLFAWSEALLGSDVHVVVGEYAIPAHSVILSLRSPVLARVLGGKNVAGLTRAGSRIEMDACHPLVALLLLQYLYSDDVAALWDSRVAHLVMSRFPTLDLPIAAIKADLKRYAEVLELAPLVAVLAIGSKTDISKTLAADLAAFHATTLAGKQCDVTIVLADREVSANSTLLRARCPFFEAMFADRDWTLERRAAGSVVVDMRHLRWRPMRLVFRYMLEGVEDLFDYVHQETLNEFLDFVFEVLAAATELLMDRLVLVCSQVIARHCDPYNAAALAAEASFYQTAVLKRSIFDYITASMETMLESGLLDDMDDDVLRDLSAAIATQQSDRAVVPRSGILVSELMAKHRSWLLQQDIPAPRVRAPQKWKPRSPVIQPADLAMTPDLKPTQGSAVDEIFSMDEDTERSERSATPKGHVWKSKTVAAERVDLRNIMAETAAAKPRPGSAGATPTAFPRIVPSVPGSSSGSPRMGSSPSGTSAPGSGPGWRTVETRKTSLTAVQAQQSPLASRPAGSQASPATGTVITPMKATPRRANGPTGPAWSTPTTYAPPPPPSSPQAPTASFSLLAIQAEERAAAARMNTKSTKSFAEIQAEERAAAAEKAQEEEFMRWWQEEEARLAGSGSRPAAGAGAGGAARARGGGAGKGTKRVPPNRKKDKAPAAGPAAPPTAGTSASANVNGNVNGNGNTSPANKRPNGRANGTKEREPKESREPREPRDGNGNGNGSGNGREGKENGPASAAGGPGAAGAGGGRSRGGRGKGKKDKEGG